MSEVISFSFPDISGDLSVYKAFLYNEAGTLLNASGNAITEVGASGVWTFTLTQARVVGVIYLARIYLGNSAIASALQFDGVLFPGQLFVDKVGDSFLFMNRSFVVGTVGATAPTTTSFTPSAITPAGVDANQWLGRILIFLSDTTTTGLRSQISDITANSAAALPLITFTALTRAPVTGDTFLIV